MPNNAPNDAVRTNVLFVNKYIARETEKSSDLTQKFSEKKENLQKTDNNGTKQSFSIKDFGYTPEFYEKYEKATKEAILAEIRAIDEAKVGDFKDLSEDVLREKFIKYHICDITKFNTAKYNGKRTASRASLGLPGSVDNRERSSFINSSEILYVDSNKKRISDWEILNRLQLPLENLNVNSIYSIARETEKSSDFTQKLQQGS